MKNLKNKINSFFISLEKLRAPLWKILKFSMEENFFSFASVICISIETDGIYLVHGKKSLWKISIKYFKKFPLEEEKIPSPELLASIVSKAINELKAAKASFILCIPRAWMIVQTAEFPITVKENLTNVVSYELDRLTPLTPDNAYYDYKVIGENTEKLNIVLAVAKADQINLYLEALKSKNIKIEKLYVSIFAIQSLIKNTYKNKSNAILISLNENAYECGVMINDSMVRSFAGNISARDGSYISNIIKENNELINILTINGYQPKFIIDSKGPGYQLVKQSLSQFAVFNLDQDIKLNLPRGNKELSNFALGSFFQKTTADQNEINLLAKNNKQQNKTQPILTIILASLIVLIGVFFILAPAQIEQRRLEEIDRRIDGLKPEMKKAEALKKEVDAISYDIANINNFKKQNNLSLAVLKEMTSKLPAKSWLTRVRITESNVEIEGYAVSAAEIIPKLENSKYFQKVEFASPTFRDHQQNNERFVIKMEFEKTNQIVKGAEYNEKKK